MTALVVLVEERSARVLLEGVLPRILPPDVEVVFLEFEGKQDLEKNIPRKLKTWRRPDSKFVVLRDQDSGACVEVKARLAAKVSESGRPALIRVACRELEAWVAGDLAAVAEAFGAPEIVSEKARAKFRDPDSLVRPVEHIQRLVPGYQKVDGARRVGPLLRVQGNSSASFRSFCSGIQRLFAATPES